MTLLSNHFYPGFYLLIYLLFFCANECVIVTINFSRWMLRLVTVCRPAKAFIFLLWASRRLYCHYNNMDDLKLFRKSFEQILSFVQTVYTFSMDKGTEFGIKKCGVLVLKRGKTVKMEGIVLTDGQVVEIDESGFKYFCIMETDQLKENETKDLFSKEYKRRLKLVLEKKLSGKHKIMGSCNSEVQRWCGRMEE